MASICPNGLPKEDDTADEARHPTRAGYLEFDILNTSFGAYRNQPLKLEQYGKVAREESIAWMSSAIAAEARAVRVV